MARIKKLQYIGTRNCSKCHLCNRVFEGRAVDMVKIEQRHMKYKHKILNHIPINKIDKFAVNMTSNKNNTKTLTNINTNDRFYQPNPNVKKINILF